MGCAGAKEKIEDQMMLMKLERMEVQMEKEKELKKLSELEGHEIKRRSIPDYIDPKFAKEKQIYDEDEYDEIRDKKTDDTIRNSVKKGKNKNKDKKDKKAIKTKEKKNVKDKNNIKKEKKEGGIKKNKNHEK